MTKPVQAVVLHRFTISAERVFDAWLDVTLLGRWMYGPAVRDERIVRLALEPKVGGKFSFVVDRQGTEVDHVGEYLEIDRPRRLVFTWATRDSLPDTSRVIVEITALDQGCDVKLTHEMGAQWTAFADKAAGAWAKMLTALERMFAPPGRS
ncbi:MAG: SRPBCC family protein [Opitutaceae bacterium]|nr:SRPBCC family protein [Opitutaceae bacterium]